uniref:Telomere repeat binding bouquet formation protein 2 n=1 Tax=Scleropages formosus TaxID=113540 RepID=A0A8C9WS03_SCLFO
MFRGKSAWFSKSVNEDLRRLWGTGPTPPTSYPSLANLSLARLHPHRIYESADYSEGKVSVFHSSYVSACGRGQNGASVAIGHYVLPPACVQQEVKAALGSFVWEQEEQHKAVTISALYLFTKLVVDCEDSTVCMLRGHMACFVTSPVGYVSADELRKYSGELHDFLPGHLGFSVTKAPCEK